MLLHCFPPARSSSHPRSAGVGSIEGRVQNHVTGDYLNNARVSIKGTNQVVLTDESGTYRLTACPPPP